MLRVRVGPLNPRVCTWGPPHEADTLPGQSRPVVPAGTPPGRAVGRGRGRGGGSDAAEPGHRGPGRGKWLGWAVSGPEKGRELQRIPGREPARMQGPVRGGTGSVWKPRRLPRLLGERGQAHPRPTAALTHRPRRSLTRDSAAARSALGQRRSPAPSAHPPILGGHASSCPRPPAPARDTSQAGRRPRLPALRPRLPALRPRVTATESRGLRVA